ncbi:plasmid transfer protein [Mucilaginibacter rubeus]|uniref:Plasmid transfer protein n=1 Tax=Mucilaginibacter rubeus TaxID=2027860 RepID=A0AAE6JMA3_9SPHI|nr:MULTISPECIES: plasmid transfer protein [Mucilaginibacter]QEM07232.1 plasmid transfer protein [Mucilaginibacter rubeus]QEM19687.1 plasmid transfer protein [Mucilaginibacter gossypii]QTE43615.1 plasmid transfer protein [Mucilaginibacter rubeus]QTE50215.1 plasmid transfer protein [Mucilaginibacter rubeus]QTE55303.1 plasmid transfer protein [Mucilaginibacter rubeus]
MKKKISAALLLLCTANQLFAQTSTVNNKTLQFLQGDGVYEAGVMVFLKGLKDSVWAHFDLFITDAKALSAIFMIIFFAIKSYEMMVGDKQLEVMPLLRPFGLAMVILWWGAFARMVAFPTDLVANQTEQMFESEQTIVNDLRLNRANLMLAMANSMYTYQAQTEVAEKESDTWYGRAWDSVTSTVKEGISSLVSPLLELKNRLTIGMQLLFTQLLEILGIWILRLAVYIIFMIQIIYSSILIILGPFAVAVSILPAFRDSFSTWIARYVSVNLYSGIAYLIMYLCGLMQEYALTSEISKYQELVGKDGASANLEKMAWFAGNGILSFGTVIIVFLIGAICMFTVPSISTWIISTSGISSATSTFGRSAGTVFGVVRKASGSFI